jgi:lipopolysaccharide cholinephosphotransferase
MDATTLRKVQLVQLSIAKEIKRICDENNIEYFLDSGTLLGAVRHKGFIPWDDDMDIGMTRENYDKFIEVAKTKLSGEYFLQTWETDKNYPMPFAKIRKNNTLFVEDNFENAKIHQGIYVDIFPYDYFPSSKRRQKRFWRKKNFLSAMLLMKCKSVKFKSNQNTFLKFILKLAMFTFIKFIVCFYTKEHIVNKYSKLVCKYEEKGSGLVYEQTQCYTFGHWVIPEECISGNVKMKFEDTYFSCPKNYDSYLTKIYGDYMTPPPEDKRSCGHHIIQIEF